MREIAEIRFTTDGKDENEAFVERYVLDAVERLPELAFCDRVAFMPFTHDAIGGSSVWITVAGDVEAVVEHESPRWNTLVDDGPVSAWEVTGVTESWYETAGERGGELLLRLHHVANQLATAVAAEFDDELPEPVDTYPAEESKHPIGWWMLLHIATAHQEYSFEETVDAFLYGILHTYEDVTEFESPDSAVQHLDDCIRSLETLRDGLED